MNEVNNNNDSVKDSKYPIVWVSYGLSACRRDHVMLTQHYNNGQKFSNISDRICQDEKRGGKIKSDVC